MINHFINFIKYYLPEANNIIAIITFLFIVLKYIVNYRYGKKCEEKFKIPFNLFTFSIEKVLIETFEYILMLTSIILLLVFVGFCNNYNVVDPLFCCLMLFPISFIYIVGIVGFIKYNNKGEIKNKKPDKCYDILKFVLIYLLIPFALTSLCAFFKKYINTIIIIIIVVMSICAIIRVICFFFSYFNFDKKKYEIIKYNDELVAILGHCKEGFIIINVESKDGTSKVKKEDLGNYRIVNKVSLFDRKFETIEVCDEGR